MTVRELVVDQLLLLSTVEAGSVPLPDALWHEITHLWSLCQTSSIRWPLRKRPYDWPTVSMSRWMSYWPSVARPFPVQTKRAEQSIPAPKASEDLSDTYRPMDNWDYRGAMDPNLVRDRTESTPEQSPASGQGIVKAELDSPVIQADRLVPVRRVPADVSRDVGAGSSTALAG